MEIAPALANIDILRRCTSNHISHRCCCIRHQPRTQDHHWITLSTSMVWLKMLAYVNCIVESMSCFNVSAIIVFPTVFYRHFIQFVIIIIIEQYRMIKNHCQNCTQLKNQIQLPAAKAITAIKIAKSSDTPILNEVICRLWQNNRSLVIFRTQ